MKTKYFSYSLGELPTGCKKCVKGQKLVLFITGICPRHCYFCPISEDKSQKDVIFANERPVKDFKDVKKEADAMGAKGAGITGGDPLAKLERTLEYIKKLKKEFGKHFHIHLYTSLNLVDKETLKKLYQVGLDEIRFHLDLDDQYFWKKLIFAKEHDWDVGIEIPIIPKKEKQLKELVDFIQDKVSFLNLNELELADTKISKLREMGFKQINDLSYAVKGSLELGLDLLDYIKQKKYNLNVHLCTVKLKDKVQMSERIKREAKHSKKDFDIVNSEGMLIRGALYPEGLEPGFDYNERINNANRKEVIKKLNKIKNNIHTKCEIDERKLRILLPKSEIRKNHKKYKKLGLKPAIVTEYPTYDHLEVEIEFK